MGFFVLVFLLFQDDHNRDVTEVKATQREEADTRRQEEKQVDVKEALTTQVVDEGSCN